MDSMYGSVNLSDIRLCDGYEVVNVRLTTTIKGIRFAGRVQVPITAGGDVRTCVLTRLKGLVNVLQVRSVEFVNL